MTDLKAVAQGMYDVSAGQWSGQRHPDENPEETHPDATPMSLLVGLTCIIVSIPTAFHEEADIPRTAAADPMAKRISVSKYDPARSA